MRSAKPVTAGDRAAIDSLSEYHGQAPGNALGSRPMVTWTKVACSALATFATLARFTFAFIALTTFTSAHAAHGAAARVRVKGTTRIDAHASREQGRLAIAGTVLDDASRPIESARAVITLTPPPGAPDRGPARLTSAGPAPRVALPSPEPCAHGASGARPLIDRGEIVVTTDDMGRFCVRLDVATDRYTAHIEARPTAVLDGSSVDLPLDLALAAVTLRFDPQPSIFFLDDAVTAVDVVASTEDDGVSAAAPALVLSLTNEAGSALGSATTGADGRARFAVPSALLPSPGPGELRVVFAGNATGGPAARSIGIERHARVDLVVHEASGSRLPPAAAEDGIVLRASVIARCARRGCAPPPTGAVEVRIGDEIVGASPLAGGEARLVLTFASASAEVPVRLRYLPDAPWFEPHGEVVLLQPIKPPSPWKKAPLALAAAAALAWVALLRLPPRYRGARRARRRQLAAQPPTQPAPGLEVVRPARESHGWTGQIADAHDGTPVAHARVTIERRGFLGIDVVAEVTCDENGSFTLPLVATRPGDELVAGATMHGSLRLAVPQPGQLSVRLVTRRRALLDRLVAWARRRGPPYHAPPDATPGHVHRAAGSDPAIARWAAAVEQAAYGSAEVDEHAQAEVEGLAPAENGRGRR